MITYDNYWEHLHVLKAQLNANGLRWDEPTRHRFDIISAQLDHFMPHLERHEQLDFYNRFMLQSWMNAMDLKFFDRPHPWPIYGWEAFVNQISSKTGVIATYHFGAYQLITYLLNRDKVPFALLVADRIFNTWPTRNKELQDVLEQATNENRFVLLNAADRTALKSMYALKDKGFYLLVYMDGIEGIHSSDSLAHIDFMGQHIEVPKGIAGLAHKLNLPLYPMIALREQGCVRIKCLSTIWPDSDSDRTVFAKDTMQYLYSWLEGYLTQWPEQWTMWAHLMAIRADVNIELQ